MGDICQVVFGEAQELTQQISAQSKKLEEQAGQVRQGVSITLTPGIWEGTGAGNFGAYVAGTYLPEVAALIASIFGMSSGLTSGLELFQKADQSALGQVNDLVGDFSFF